MSVVGKIQLRFEVLDSKSRNPYTINILDTSEWRLLEDMPAYLHVTLPDSRKPINLPFYKGEINGLNSVNLGVTCFKNCEDNFTELPDGIYKLQITGGKDGIYEYTTYYLKTDTIRRQLDEMWVKLGLEYSNFDTKEMEKLFLIQGLLNSAESASRLGMADKAYNSFILAKKRIEKCHIR